MHFIWSLARGGAERQLVELVRASVRAGYDPALILARGDDDFGLTREVPTVVVSDSEHIDARWLGRFVVALRRLRPALVHSWMGSLNWYARLAAPLAGRPKVIGSVRAMQLPTADIVREALSHPLASAVIVNSAGTREELVRRAGLPAEKLFVVENGLDATRFAPLDEPARTAAREALGFAGARVWVMLARVCPQKNQLGVVRALAALSARGALPADVRLALYGRTDDAAYAAAVRDEVARAGLGDRVTLRAATDDAATVLAAADAVLSPSVFEGLPNAVIEGLACGTPALVTPAANVDVLVVDGRDGVVCADPSPVAIAEGLGRLLARDDDAVARMRSASRGHAAARFTVERMAAATMAVYDRVLG